MSRTALNSVEVHHLARGPISLHRLFDILTGRKIGEGQGEREAHKKNQTFKAMMLKKKKNQKQGQEPLEIQIFMKISNGWEESIQKRVAQSRVDPHKNLMIPMNKFFHSPHDKTRLSESLG